MEMVNKAEKHMVKSKTLQLNGVAIVVSYILASYGIDIPAEIQITVLGLFNTVIRFFTSGSISFK